MEKENNKVYLVNDIQKILRLGRTKTYEFLEKVYKNKEPFTVIKVGKLYRVPKNEFDNWVDGGLNNEI